MFYDFLVFFNAADPSNQKVLKKKKTSKYKEKRQQHNTFILPDPTVDQEKAKNRVKFKRVVRYYVMGDMQSVV